MLIEVGDDELRDRWRRTTQQMRTVGQRRREAEEKLEHHLEEARHKNDLHGETAAIQHIGNARQTQWARMLFIVTGRPGPRQGPGRHRGPRPNVRAYR